MSYAKPHSQIDEESAACKGLIHKNETPSSIKLYLWGLSVVSIVVLVFTIANTALTIKVSQRISTAYTASTLPYYSASLEVNFPVEASVTNYEIYPRCCKGTAATPNPGYDKDASTAECDNYSGCRLMGQLAAYPNETPKYTFEEVKELDLIALFDKEDSEGKIFKNDYAKKKATLTTTYKGKTIIFEAEIVDTCHDNDCSGCCTRNAGDNRFLVDLEYFTAQRYFGNDLDAVPKTIEIISIH